MENYYVLIESEMELKSTARMVSDFCFGQYCQLFNDRDTNTVKITTKEGFQLALNNAGIRFYDHPVYVYGIAEINIGGDLLTFARVKYFTKEKPSKEKSNTRSGQKTSSTYGGYSSSYSSSYGSSYSNGRYNGGYSSRR